MWQDNEHTFNRPLENECKSIYHITTDSCHLMLEDEDLFKPLIVKIAKERNLFTLVLSVDAGSSLKHAEWDLVSPYLTYIYI